MRQKRRRGLTAVLLVLLLLLALMPAAGAAGSFRGKLIHVVYDNSGSMAQDYTTRWCQAKYAMEVFAAMLGEDDVMTIYPLNDINGYEALEAGLTVQGSDAGRVAKIHDMQLSGNASTPFGPVILAGDDLLAAPEEYEKWLVVITDGGFDGGRNPQPVLDAYNEQGIKTIFLTIQTATRVQENPGMGAWVLSAADGVDILNKITAAANQIFEHQVLPASHISESGKKTVLDIDLSTDELIVFAQGENVRIGTMSLNGSAIAASAMENVKFSDVLPFNGARQDKSLKGVLAVYKGSFEPGLFELEISGATTVEYYYRPDVMVNCELRYQGQTVMMGDELYAGDYEAVMNFVSPDTRQPVQSDLLQTVNFTLVAENNGQVTTLPTAVGNVSLDVGRVTLTVTAELPGNVMLTDTKEYKVLPEPVALRLDFSSDQPFYTISSLRDGTAEFVMTVTREDGTPLTSAEAAEARVQIPDDSGIHWEAAPGSDPGTWVLRPSIADENALRSGTLSFPAEVAFEMGEQPFRGSGSLTMDFEQFVNADLVLEIRVPADAGYELPDIRPLWLRIIRPVELRLLDADGRPVTPEVAEGISLSFRSSNGVDWVMEQTQDPASWILKPGRGLKPSLIGRHGPSDLTIEASGAVGDYLYRGTGGVNVNFGPINPFWLMVYAIALAALLIFIGGFLFRKKLNVRSLNPHCRLVTHHGERIEEGQTIRIRRKLTWWAPERAYVACNDPDMHCDFPDLRIEATAGRGLKGSRSFIILNWQEIDVKKVTINGNLYEDNKELQNKSFTLTRFTISSIAKGDPENVRGFFKFT